MDIIISILCTYRILAGRQAFFWTVIQVYRLHKVGASIYILLKAFIYYANDVSICQPLQTWVHVNSGDENRFCFLRVEMVFILGLILSWNGKQKSETDR